MPQEAWRCRDYPDTLQNRGERDTGTRLDRQGRIANRYQYILREVSRHRLPVVPAPLRKKIEYMLWPPGSSESNRFTAMSTPAEDMRLCCNV
jgi:hypothetical protein